MKNLPPVDFEWLMRMAEYEMECPVAVGGWMIPLRDKGINVDLYYPWDQLFEPSQNGRNAEAPADDPGDTGATIAPVLHEAVD